VARLRRRGAARRRPAPVGPSTWRSPTSRPKIRASRA